jgi:hypothetical protein
LGGYLVAPTPLQHDAAAPDRLEGKVLAIDPRFGGFLLGTDAGTIALRAEPEDLAQMQIGQTLEVEVVDDESSSPGKATPPGR